MSDTCKCICTGCGFEAGGCYIHGDLFEMGDCYIFNAVGEFSSVCRDVRVLTVSSNDYFERRNVFVIHKSQAILNTALKEYIA